jgi:hypothetical protein
MCGRNLATPSAVIILMAIWGTLGKSAAALG